MQIIDATDPLTVEAHQQVTGFDGGWIVKRRNGRDVSVVVGDDGGFAYFDPRWVDDLRAATEYRAGRGREPGSS